MTGKQLMALRKQERYFDAVEAAARAADAVYKYFRELERNDPKLRKLVAESDAAEKKVRELRA